MNTKNRRVDPLPEKFSSYEEAAEFWDTHDTTDYLDAFQPVTVQAEFRRRHYEVEIDKDVLFALRDRGAPNRCPCEPSCERYVAPTNRDRRIDPSIQEKFNLPTVNEYFQRVADLLPRIPADQVERIIGILTDAQAKGRRIFMFGNGGSSANASHIVNDLVKSVLVAGRPRMRVFCLSDNTPLLTAYSNDVSYDVVFADPLAALAEPGDVAFAISGSGNSPNVLRAMDVAKEMGLTRIGLAGLSGGALEDKCDICVVVPSDSMQAVEDAHLVILHAIYLALCD